MPLHRLACSYPAIVLALLESEHDDTISKHAITNVEQFLAGEAVSLYRAAREYQGWTPAKKAARAEELPQCLTDAAQIAADAGNLSGACNILCNSCPIALFNDAVIAKAEELHPQEGCDGQSTEVTEPAVGDDTTCFDVPDEMLLKFFRRMPTGKGGGPDSNVSDTLQNLALSTDSVNSSHPHLRTVWSYLLLFLLNDVPDKAQEEYAMQILTML